MIEKVSEIAQVEILEIIDLARTVWTEVYDLKFLDIQWVVSSVEEWEANLMKMNNYKGFMKFIQMEMNISDKKKVL